MSASFLSGSIVPKKISACTAHAEEFYASIMLSCFGCDSRIHGWFFIIAVLPCSCNSSPAGSVFRYLGDGLRLQIANCASRSAPSPRRSLGAGAEAADPGAGAAYGGQRWAGGSHRRPISRRLSGAIIIRPNLCTTIRPALEQSVSLSLACLEDSHISEAIA